MELFSQRCLLLLPADGAILLAVVSAANLGEVLFLSPPTVSSWLPQTVSSQSSVLWPQLHKNGCLLHHLSRCAGTDCRCLRCVFLNNVLTETFRDIRHMENCVLTS